ncbi:MAG: transglutaminase-like domain-containing protein [Solirubrobacteraceae bacterium]
MTRRPAALLAPRVARLAAFALLALAGALQWVRYVEGADAGRAVLWVVAATITGALVLLAGNRRWALAAAALAGAGLAVGASGLDLTYLEPNHVDELASGVSRGADALTAVRLPYLGREPWVLTTVQLSGAALCWAAALLACWPGGRGRVSALTLLLVLAAVPIVSIGADSPALLGFALALLVAAFLWLERLARHPGLSLAGLVVGLALVAVPAGLAADRDAPWFDYRAFSERLAGGTPVSFDWDHQYGPLDWGREGVELFRVEGSPRYWRVQGLNTFDGRLWTSEVRSDDPANDLPTGPLREEWTTKFSVAINLLETEQVVSSGTTLAIDDATQEIEENDDAPGQFVATDGESLSKGDSYTATVYAPSPGPAELAEATVGGDPRRADALVLDVELPEAMKIDVPGEPLPLEADEAVVSFPPFESGNPPLAEYERLGFQGGGDDALRASLYDRTWELAQRLKRRADSPYDYVLAVNRHLAGPGFAYTETPPRTPAGEAPLEDFIVDSQRGYCQQFSGAMALLLRMGGVPARVATGFTPGGQPPSGEWVVRDTDAHSWVEVWFDDIGWVTFDPTPAATPARSQTAAIDQPTEEGVSGSDAAQTGPAATNLEPKNPRDVSGADTGAGPGAATSDDGGSSWPWVGLALAVALVAGAVWAARRAGARAATAHGALAELERALRRAGRAASPSTTLAGLEQRLDTPGDGYLRALRAARYGSGAQPPSPEQRAAFRRRLAADLGWGGRLRALYALPPTLPRRPR